MKAITAHLQCSTSKDTGKFSVPALRIIVQCSKLKISGWKCLYYTMERHCVAGGTQAVVPQLLAAPAVPYSSPSVFNVSGNQLTQQLYAGLTVNQPTAILGAIQQPQLVAVPHPSPAQLRPTAHAGSGNAVMTSSGGGAGALQPLIYWYPPGGQVSPAGNAYLMPTCATPTAATRGLAQVPDMLSC